MINIFSSHIFEATKTTSGLGGTGGGSTGGGYVGGGGGYYDPGNGQCRINKCADQFMCC